MPQVRTKIKGEYTYASEYSEVPEGALKSAQNCVINRDSVAEPRRGFGTYAAISTTSTDRADKFLFYKNVMFAHYGTSISMDGANPFTAMTGTFSAPSHGDSYVPKIKFMEANSNLYFTSSNGIQKLDSTSGTIQKAGAPRGLDVNLSLTGASGFMSNNTQVAYRIVWGYSDANTNLILGSPSQRAVVTNTGGTAANVIVNSSVPQEATVNWFFQVYRTALSLDQNTDPGDEAGLVYESNPNSTDLSNKYIQFTDQTPDSLRGASLYTDASQQGIAQANDTPPSSKDLALFKGMSLYGNTIQKQSLTVTLLASGSSLGVSYASYTGNITSGSPTVTTVSSMTGIAVGQTITGVGIAASTTITAINTGSSTITMSANASATTSTLAIVSFDTITINSVAYLANASEDAPNRKFQVFTSGTAAQNIANTAQSLVKVINRNASNTTIYAYYTSGATDLPGQIFLEARSLSVAAFTVTASSNSQAWNPSLPTSGSTVQSSAEQHMHRLHVSKLQQPEACPRAQFYDIGSAQKALLRVVPLRDSTIIMKEDGYFRLTGTTPQNIVIDPLDLTTLVLAPETVVPLNNQVYAITNQGMSTASDTGIGVISRPIEDQILPTIAFSNFKTVAFAVPYESERQYILFTPQAAGETFATKEIVYNTFTQAFTHWLKPATCAAVNPADNKLYLGSPTSNTLLQERKALDFTDFSDEDIAVTISNVSGNLVTVNSIIGISVGDVLLQGTLSYAEVTSIDSINSILTMDQSRGWSNASATIKTSYECRIDFTAQYCGNPGVMKHIREIHPLLKDAEFRHFDLIFSSDLMLSEQSLTVTGFVSFLWGNFPWGAIPWGGYSGIYKFRTWVLADYQRCTWLNASFRHRGAYAKFALSGLEFTYEIMSERTGT